MEVSHATARPSRPLVFFAGPWAEEDIATIERTLHTVEERLNLPPAERASLWTCSHATTPRDVYALSRYGMGSVVAAQSIGELRLRLLDMAGAIITF